MVSKRQSSLLVAVVAAVAVSLLAAGVLGVSAQAQDDPVVAKIIQLGRTDNQVMRWADYASNRFGGRVTGSNAYNDATAWAVWQFKQWGIDAELDEVGEVPLAVTKEAAGDAEKAHADDGQAQVGDGGVEGGAGDQVGRQGHQADAAADRRHA